MEAHRWIIADRVAAMQAKQSEPADEAFTELSEQTAVKDT